MNIKEIIAKGPCKVRIESHLFPAAEAVIRVSIYEDKYNLDHFEYPRAAFVMDLAELHQTILKFNAQIEKEVFQGKNPKGKNVPLTYAQYRAIQVLIGFFEDDWDNQTINQFRVVATQIISTCHKHYL